MVSLVPGPTSDQSVYFLWQIFGNIIYWISGTDISGNDATFIHEIINSFNTGLLSLLLVVYSAVLFVGTLNTAHQGEFLGKNWSSLWMPIRALIGPICIVPVKYGFCLVQIALLYCVLAGVQFANYVWTNAQTSLGQGVIPAVPSSVLTEVKNNVGMGVMYGSIQQVLTDLDLDISSKNEVAIDPTTFGCTNSDYDNKFATYNGNLIYCINSLAVLPNELMPKLTSYTNSLCSIDYAMNDFTTAMKWFYQDPYNHDGQTISDPGYTPITASTLTQQCSNAVNQMLSSEASSQVDYKYTFLVDTSYESIHILPSIGNTTDNGSNGKQTYVPTTGNIQFNFTNTDYTDGQPGSENPYSEDAYTTTNTIIADLYQDDINSANQELNNYLIRLNQELLDYLATAPESSVESLGNTTDENGQPVSYYDQCKNYLNSDSGDNQKPTIRYLECLQLSQSNQTYSITDHSDPDYPYKSYIDSWWIGGQSYLAVDSIMNNNIATAINQIDTWLAYPGFVTTSTVQYDAPMSVIMYPEVNSSNISPEFDNPYTQKDTDGKSYDTGMFHTSGNLNSTTNAIPDGIDSFSSSWVTNVNTAVPACSTAITTQEQQDNCNNLDTLRNNLFNLPVSLQPAFQYLFMALINSSTDLATNPGAPHEVDLLNNMFQLLAMNSIYQPTTTTSVPVYAVIDKIFGHVGGNGLSTDITSIMNEFYSLGMPSSDVYSKIMQAQQIGADVIQAVVDSFSNIFDNFKDQFKDIRSTVKTMTNTWMHYSFGAGVVDGITGGSSSAAVATAGQTIIQLYLASQMANMSLSLAWLPLAFVILGSLFTAAISFSVMMPLIPYFLFWAGTIVWVLSILEGLIAAPIVALAVVYPEGHEILGHGSPSVKILLNLIFRPVLMVIGVLTAISLTYVIITYSAQGFHLVAPLILGNFVASSMVTGIVSCFLLFIYTSFMMLAFSKCFSVIYLLPDKVFEYIGAQSNNRAGADDVQQLQGKADSASGQAGQAAGQSTQQATQAQQTKTQSQAQAQQQKIQVGEKAGREVGQDASSAAKKGGSMGSGA